jgi:hypothetical protein
MEGFQRFLSEASSYSQLSSGMYLAIARTLKVPETKVQSVVGVRPEPRMNEPEECLGAEVIRGSNLIADCPRSDHVVECSCLVFPVPKFLAFAPLSVEQTRQAGSIAFLRPQKPPVSR